jgi:terminase small subunit-like protein
LPAEIVTKFEEVCRLLETGDTIKSACHKLAVNPRAFFDWRQSDPQLGRRFEDAQELGFEAQADDLAHIHEAIANPLMARVVSENRRWLLARRFPKKYGDKISDNSANANLVDTLREAIARIPRPVSDQPLTIDGRKPTEADVFGE